MKRRLTGVGLICLTLTGSAQTLDTPRTRTHNQMRFLRDLRASALADQDNVGAARLAEMEAFALSSLGNTSDGSEVAGLFREAAILYSQGGAARESAVMFLAKGRTEWSLKEFRNALEDLDQAEQGAAKTNDPCLKAEAWISQARVHFSLGGEAEVQKANRILTEAMKLENATCSLGPLLSGEAELLSKQRNTTSAATRFARLAAEAFSKEGQPNNAGEALLKLAAMSPTGNTAARRAMAEDRQGALIDAIRFFQTARNDDGVALARLQQATLAKETEAKPLLDEADAIFTRLGDENGLGRVSLARARLIFGQDAWIQLMDDAQMHFERSQSWAELAGVWRTRIQVSRDAGDLKAVASGLLGESRAWRNARMPDAASGASSEAARILCSNGDIQGGRVAFRDAMAYASFDFLQFGAGTDKLMAELKACTEKKIPVKSTAAPPKPPGTDLVQAGFDRFLERLRPIDQQLNRAEMGMLSGNLLEIEHAANDALRRLDEIDRDTLAGVFPGGPSGMSLTEVARSRSCRLLGQIYTMMNRAREAEAAYQCAVRVEQGALVSLSFGFKEELNLGPLRNFGSFRVGNSEIMLSGVQLALQLAPRLAGDEELQKVLGELINPIEGSAADTSLARLRKARDVFRERGETLAEGHSWMLEAQLLPVEDSAAVILAARRALETIPVGQLPATRFLAAMHLFKQYSDDEDKGKEAEEAALLAFAERERWAGGIGAMFPSSSDTFGNDIFSLDNARAFLLERLAKIPARQLQAMAIADWNPDARKGAPGIDASRQAGLNFLRTRLAELENGAEKTGSADDRLSKREVAEAALYFSHRITEALDARPAGPPLGSQAIASLADRLGPILMLVESDDGAWGFLLRPGKSGVVAHQLKFSADRVDELLKLLGAKQPFEKVSKQLWLNLISPFRQDMEPFGGVSVVPLGAISRIPFSLLMDEQGRYLFQQKAVSVAPSLRFLAEAKATPGTAAGGPLTILSGGTDAQLPLPTVAAIEAASPIAHRSSDLDFKSYGTLAPGSSMLVIATHGAAGEGASENYLQIGASAGHDSHFRAFEIAETPLQAELVALVVCDAIKGADSSNTSELGLASAFLRAGAKAVLAARWKLQPVSATYSFVTDFIRSYAATGRARDALNSARQESFRRGDPPLQWAAWELIGIAAR